MTSTKDRDRIAVILAIGLVLSLIIITVAVLWIAIVRNTSISEQGSRILTVLLGGLIGILGAYMGFYFGKKNGSSE